MNVMSMKAVCVSRQTETVSSQTTTGLETQKESLPTKPEQKFLFFAFGFFDDGFLVSPPTEQVRGSMCKFVRKFVCKCV